MLEKHDFSRYELMAVEKFLAGLQTAAMNALTDQTDPYEFFVVLDGYPACHIMGLILRIYESQTKVLVREKAVQTVNERFEHHRTRSQRRCVHSDQRRLKITSLIHIIEPCLPLDKLNICCDIDLL